MQSQPNPNDSKNPLFSRLPRPSLRQRRLIAMSGAAAIVVISLGAFALLPPVRHIQAADSNPMMIAANDTGRSTPRMLENSTPFSFADLVERVSPAVVTIKSETISTQSDSEDTESMPSPFRDFFNQFGQGPAAAAAAQGDQRRFGLHHRQGRLCRHHNHVIDASKKITVTLPDKREFTAKLVGTDPSTDIALLKITSDKPLPIVEFGDDKRLRVGDWVIAVGNPFGLSNSVTAGIVSSIGRDIESSQAYTNFIQIDAPINRGNSGGPTFDLHGQVIGMNSMIFSPSGGSVGIGFAIPASLIHDVVAQLKEHGQGHARLAGSFDPAGDAEIASAMGLKENKGAIVASVVAGGPGAKAGFEQGDVVTAIDGQAVEDSRDVVRRVAALTAGRTSVFSISRQGKAMQVKVTIGQRPEDKVAANLPSGGPNLGPAAASAMGLGLSSLTPESRRAYNLADDVAGVVITKVDPDSDAADKGLQPGDVVLKIGNHAVKSPSDVQSGIAEAQKGGHKSVLLLVARQSGGTGFVAVDIGQT